jgi:hypothetical protein
MPGRETGSHDSCSLGGALSGLKRRKRNCSSLWLKATKGFAVSSSKWVCFLVAALTASTAAYAGYRDFIARADQALEDAADAAQGASDACRQAVNDKLQRAARSVASLRHVESPADIDHATVDVESAGMAAVLASCPRAVADPMREAGDALTRARSLRMKDLATAGTNEPPSSAARRAGPLPMSERDFGKLLAAVAATKDELAKGDLVKNALGAVGLSSQQLGSVLDALSSDVVKLDLVNAVAPELTDPEHGSSLASHFDNSELAHEAVVAVERGH